MAINTGLLAGDPAPWFQQRCTTPSGHYTFDMAAGRYVVLFLFRSSTEESVATRLAVVRRELRGLFDDRDGSFFGVSADPSDEDRLRAELPGLRYFRDTDGLVRGLFLGGRMEPAWFLLDRSLRVIALEPDHPEAPRRIADFLRCRLADGNADEQAVAPVLLVPHVFEPAFCQALLTYFEQAGSQPSGVFTQAPSADSRIVLDDRLKRRSDCQIRDRALVAQVQARIVRRIIPAVRNAFQFEATELDRLIIAAYDSADRGHFSAHRDNTVSATAHRKFAVSINLNGDFEGGELSFPEFGTRRYRPAPGGAVIFSCSLMHLVTPVTDGRRVACLPFIYDAAGAETKRSNRRTAQSD